MTEKSCDLGLFGLGVMGRNFALNMADKGFRVAVHNRREEKRADSRKRMWGAARFKRIDAKGTFHAECNS